MISFNQKGDFSKITGFMERAKQIVGAGVLNKHGEVGVKALSMATPADSGITSDSWSYRIRSSKGEAKIEWFNSNRNGSFPIAIMIQLGHGTRGRTWVQGRDYINPIMRPVFDQIAQDVWREVTKL